MLISTKNIYYRKGVHEKCSWTLKINDRMFSHMTFIIHKNFNFNKKSILNYVWLIIIILDELYFNNFYFMNWRMKWYLFQCYFLEIVFFEINMSTLLLKCTLIGSLNLIFMNSIITFMERIYLKISYNETYSLSVEIIFKIFCCLNENDKIF